MHQRLHQCQQVTQLLVSTALPSITLSSLLYSNKSCNTARQLKISKVYAQFQSTCSRLTFDWIISASSVAILSIQIHKLTHLMIWGEVETFAMGILLEIRPWKNFENRINFWLSYDEKMRGCFYDSHCSQRRWRSNNTWITPDAK